MKFDKPKTIENLLKFALSFAQGKVIHLNDVDAYKTQMAKTQSSNDAKPWLISFCISTHEENEDEDVSELNYELNCLDDMIKLKLSIILDGLVNVASVECSNKNQKENLCKLLKVPRSSPLMFYDNLAVIQSQQEHESEQQIKSEKILTSDYKQIVKLIYSYLPELNALSEENFNQILANLRDKNKQETPWLIQFVNNDQNKDNELKKLPTLLGPSGFIFALFIFSI